MRSVYIFLQTFLSTCVW